MEKTTIEQRCLNAEKVANQLFPGEKWILVEKGIYLSSHRPIGKKSNYMDELRDAQILRDLGSTIYLVPENNRQRGRKYDAIVDGLKMEFKNMKGKSEETLIDHFLDSRGQAPNVFINLEKSPLQRKKVLQTLYRARNSDDYLKKSKDNIGGLVILKISGMNHLIYLNVDDLQKQKKPNV